MDIVGNFAHFPALNGGAQRGHHLGNLGLMTDAAIAIRDDKIVAVGQSEDIHQNYYAIMILDASDRLVTPGLVDPHTHLVWAGDRAEEYEMRLAGASYQDIQAAGGGINKTVRDTPAATLSGQTERTKDT